MANVININRNKKDDIEDPYAREPVGGIRYKLKSIEDYDYRGYWDMIEKEYPDRIPRLTQYGVGMTQMLNGARGAKEIVKDEEASKELFKLLKLMIDKEYSGLNVLSIPKQYRGFVVNDKETGGGNILRNYVSMRVVL